MGGGEIRSDFIASVEDSNGRFVSQVQADLYLSIDAINLFFQLPKEILEVHIRSDNIMAYVSAQTFEKVDMVKMVGLKKAPLQIVADTGHQLFQEEAINTAEELRMGNQKYTKTGPVYFTGLVIAEKGFSCPDIVLQHWAGNHG